MGKKGDPKAPILPSRTRRGTTLSTSATLDSPSVTSKFDSPQLNATSAESGNMSDTFDDASTTFDTTGSLGSFIEEQIAAAARFSGVEIPVTKTPIGKTHGYPDLTGLKERLVVDMETADAMGWPKRGTDRGWCRWCQRRDWEHC